ncbi:cytochrome P450 [Xylariaceae sp. AK1471]|nr:cytochrome P450 [Xylariaceae sp. AK1471]
MSRFAPMQLVYDSDETYFVRPDEWIPERFTTRPELVLNKHAFVARSIGKKSCLGKNLSLMETRVAAALLLSEFDMEIAPGEDGDKMFTEMTDFFTTTPGPLQVILKSRRME